MYYEAERDKDIEILAGIVINLGKQLDEQKDMLLELSEKVEVLSKNSNKDENTVKQDTEQLFAIVAGMKDDMRELDEAQCMLTDRCLGLDEKIPWLTHRTAQLESKRYEYSADIAMLKDWCRKLDARVQTRR
jgi:hypothetical protein